MTKRRIIWTTLLPTMLIGFMGLMLIKNVPPALAGPNSQSNTPGLISYQGYLTDSAGQPLNGTVSLTFGLYEAVSGGSPLWSETQTNVPVSNGYFSVMLGSVTPLNAANFNGPSRYLQVTVDSGSGPTELPRQQFAAVPYALQAANAWSLTGNGDTTPGPNFLGTTDAVSLTLVVSGTTALRIEPAVDFTQSIYPNIIGGHSSNSISSDNVYGAVIGGGKGNVAGGVLSTIGGGNNNTTGGGGYIATVGGGNGNTANGITATVSGGSNNTASGDFATVSGGRHNSAEGDYSFAAGYQATANHNGAFVWSDSSSTDFTSTGIDQFLIEANGGMGVGTNAPATQLHVVTARNGTASLANHVMVVENNAATVGSGPDVLALRVTNQSNPGSSTNYITFADQSGGIAAIEGNGSGGVSYNTTGADFAEYLPLHNPQERIRPAEIVGIIEGRVSKQTAGAEQLFVTSSTAGFVGNMPPNEQTEGLALVAMMGQVPVRAHGPVQAGDYIIPSAQADGLGRAISPAELTPELAGQVVGQALAGSVGAGESEVQILVGLPRDQVWATLLQQKESQNEILQARVTALETRFVVLEGQLSPPTKTSSGLLWFVTVVGLGLVGLLWLMARLGISGKMAGIQGLGLSLPRRRGEEV